MNIKGPVVLVILDGFGYRKDQNCNAIAQAKKRTFDNFLKNYPWKLLEASGAAVGVLPGMVGNSEVGHETIGAGRIIKQPVVLINESIADGSFFDNHVLIEAYTTLKNNNRTLHIIGLLSNGGVHCLESQMFAYLELACRQGLSEVIIHPILDGRDVPPQSACLFLERLERKIDELGIGVIGSLQGRFYAMDRDGNNDRTQQSFQALLGKPFKHFATWRIALDYFYARNIFDEYVPPVAIGTARFVCDGDGVLFANYRPDRMRQLVRCFLSDKKLKLSWLITAVPYGIPGNIKVVLPVAVIKPTLKELLSDAGKTIFSIAETEKYAHVTYFFGGGQEEPFQHEQRELVPSLKEKNYIDHPRMSADEITRRVVHALHHDRSDFYLINYANADMVGHSGDLRATIKAVECLDEQLAILYQEVVVKGHGILIITGDHGKAEQMFDPATGQPCTAHTANPVYFVVVSSDRIALPDVMVGLSDIAPFILKLFRLNVPMQMIK